MKQAAIFLVFLVAATSAREINQSMRPIGADRFYEHIKDSQGSRIVGGVESVPNSRPYQVGLFLTLPGGTAFCGGSLISKNWVMTAAHCVNDGRNVVESFEVVLGAHNIRNDPNAIKIVSDVGITHPNWSSLTLQNDIALIKLPVDVEFSDIIQPAKLPSRSSESNTFVDYDATVSGWGKDSDASNTISDVLRQVTVPVKSNAACNTWYFGVIQPSHICASGTGGKSSCNGDSGGPLTVEEAGEEIQVGIVSFGVALGCEVGWPSAYTRVTSYLDWISETAGITID